MILDLKRWGNPLELSTQVGSRDMHVGFAIPFEPCTSSVYVVMSQDHSPCAKERCSLGTKPAKLENIVASKFSEARRSFPFFHHQISASKLEPQEVHYLVVELTQWGFG